MAQLVNEELTKILQAGVTDREVERAMNGLRSQYLDNIAAVGGFSGKADLLNYYNFFVGNPDYIQQDLARFEAVTPADVHRVARIQFAKPKVVLTVVPEGQTNLMVKGGAQ
jgi:zinc protease